jgi:hypothetical protein
MPAVSRVLAQFDRVQLGSAIEVMIALLDVQDSEDDPDAPDFSPRSDRLPGDPGDHEPAGDEEAGAYVEWHTKSASERRAGSPERGPDGAWFGSQEDDELSGDERDAAWTETDRNWQAGQPDAMIVGDLHEDAEEDDHPGDWANEDELSGYSQVVHAGPGCPISDPGGCQYD